MNESTIARLLMHVVAILLDSLAAVILMQSSLNRYDPTTLAWHN
jgi:hypothetical protein